MQQIASPHPPGTVIVPTSGTPRYMEFYDALDLVEVPVGTRKIVTKSCELAAALNQACAQAVGEWVWFLGDDHTFDRDIVLRLLGHGLPAVGPLNIQRQAPFGPVVLRGELGPTVRGISWMDVPVGTGLWYLPADMHTGQAGLLIRRAVLDQVPKPIFRVGQLSPERLNEDFWLTKSLREMGIPAVIDLGTTMGHLNAFAARPFLRDGTWQVGFSQNNRMAFATEGL